MSAQVNSLGNCGHPSVPHASPAVAPAPASTGTGETGRRPAAGFGLIELMVAMTLGLLVVGAAFGIFMSNQRTFQANSGINRIQEGARVAFEMISNDLRAAGGSSCSNLAAPGAEHANTTYENAFLTTPVSGNSSEFTVVSGDDAAYPVTASTVNSVDVDVNKVKAINPNFKLTDAFKVGQPILVCSANQLYVVNVTAVSKTQISFSPGTPIPLTTDPMAPASSVMVSRFRNNRWYLDNGSLYVDRGGGGQQVIENVGAMSMTYLRRGATTYTAAPAQWSDVVAVRVNMTLNGQDAVDGNTITRNFSNVVSLRSRTP